MTTGLLLFAHGARDPNWALPFQEVARRAQAASPGLTVALSFLEFMAPTLPEAGAALVATGCTRVEVVPLFLGAGGHVRRDLPQLLAQLQAAHPTVQWTLRSAVGEHSTVIEAMARCALAWCAERTGDTGGAHGASGAADASAGGAPGAAMK